MAQHDPNRMRPSWGATSTCTRCGMAITFRGRWLDRDRSNTCEQRYGTPDHKPRSHRSATAGTPPVSQNAAASEGAP